MISFEALAKEAYESYRSSVQCADSAGRVWGQPVPGWTQLEVDHQQAWIDAAKTMVQRLQSLH